MRTRLWAASFAWVAVFYSGVAGIELFNVSCQVFCEKCPAGQYVDKSSYLQSCYACPAGKYADEEGTSECTDCPVGKAHNITSADDSSTCADCRVGQYQDSPGSTACTSCDAGQYQGAVGKTYCDSCTVGWYQSQSGQSKCAPCPEHSGSCKLEIQVRPDPRLPPPPAHIPQSLPSSTSANTTEWGILPFTRERSQGETGQE